MFTVARASRLAIITFRTTRSWLLSASRLRALVAREEVPVAGAARAHLAAGAAVLARKAAVQEATVGVGWYGSPTG
jgi:hypothetical protein